MVCRNITGLGIGGLAVALALQKSSATSSI